MLPKLVIVGLELLLLSSDQCKKMFLQIIVLTINHKQKLMVYTSDFNMTMIWRTHILVITTGNLLGNQAYCDIWFSVVQMLLL